MVACTFEALARYNGETVEEMLGIGFNGAATETIAQASNKFQRLCTNGGRLHGSQALECAAEVACTAGVRGRRRRSSCAKCRSCSECVPNSED